MENKEDNKDDVEVVSVEEELKNLSPDASEACSPHY